MTSELNTHHENNPSQDSALPSTLSFMTQENRIGFLPRYKAVSTDGIISWAGGFLLALPLKPFFTQKVQDYAGRSLDQQSLEIGSGLIDTYSYYISLIAGVTILAILWAIMEAFVGFTPGKWFQKIRIRKDNGTRADPAALILRAFIKNSSFIWILLAILYRSMFFSILSSIASLFVSIGLLWVFAAGRQTLHDRIAETAVYSLNNLSGTPTETWNHRISRITQKIAAIARHGQNPLKTTNPGENEQVNN